MKKKRVSLISGLLCLSIIVGIIYAARIEIHGVSGPLLYYNDKVWEREDKLPIVKVRSIYYIPAAVFGQLDGFEVRTNTKQKTFIIEYNGGEMFLSFDTTSDFALSQDNDQIYLPTYEFYGERYVPWMDICKRFGLKYERLVSTVTGEVALRISDGSQKIEFITLIKSKYPGFYYPDESQTTTGRETTRETTPAVTDPPDTDEPKPVLTDRTIYITIEDSPGEYTDEILEVLGRYGYHATFFVTGKNIMEDPTLLSRIVSEGHEIGLHTMDPSEKFADAGEILADIEEENELISGYIKRKSSIWRAPEGSKKLSVLNRAAEMELNHAGYLVWDWNIEASGRTAEKAAESVIDGIWENETAVIRLVEGENTAEILETVLAFIAENAGACDVRTITPALYEYNLIAS